MHNVLLLARESGANISVWKDYLNIMTDPAHLGSELTMILIFDGIIGLGLWPLIKRAVRKHDEKHHAPKFGATAPDIPTKTKWKMF